MIQASSVEVPLKAYWNVLQCLLTKRLGQGRFIKEFEERVKWLFGVRHCITTSNGTQADLVMLLALKEMYPHKTDVIMPAFTFPAQSNAVIMAGLNPVFVDVTKDFCIDWNLVNPTENTLCIFPTHLLGYSAKIPKEVTYKSVPVLEDCCEAMLGRDVRGLFGKSGIAGSFSMFPSHLITTGEGGFIITDNTEFANLCRKIINHGKVGDDFDFLPFGTNSKWNNMSAAVGCSVLERAEEYRKLRVENFKKFNQYLGINRTIPTSPHAYPYLCESTSERNVKLEWIKEVAPDCRKMFPCIPDLSDSIKRFGFPLNDGFNNARNFRNHGLTIPCSHKLKEEDIEGICLILRTK